MHAPFLVYDTVHSARSLSPEDDAAIKYGCRRLSSACSSAPDKIIYFFKTVLLRRASSVPRNSTSNLCCGVLANEVSMLTVHDA